MFAGGQPENDGRRARDDAVEKKRPGQAHVQDENRRQEHGQQGAQIEGQRPQAGGRGPLLGRKPASRDFGDGPDDEGLADGDAHLADEDDGEIVGEDPAGQAEDGRQTGPDPDRLAEAPCIDGTGRRQEHQDIDAHEAHREQADHHVASVIESGRGARHGCEGDPEHLGHAGDEDEGQQDDPAVTIFLDGGLIGHGFLLKALIFPHYRPSAVFCQEDPPAARRGENPGHNPFLLKRDELGSVLRESKGCVPGFFRCTVPSWPTASSAPDPPRCRSSCSSFWRRSSDSITSAAT